MLSSRRVALNGVRLRLTFGAAGDWAVTVKDEQVMDVMFGTGFGTEAVGLAAAVAAGTDQQCAAISRQLRMAWSAEGRFTVGEDKVVVAFKPLADFLVPTSRSAPMSRLI